MWVFFSVLVALGLFLFGPFQAELKTKKGGKVFSFSHCPFAVSRFYRGVFFLHFKHVVRPQIIKVKKAGLRKFMSQPLSERQRSTTSAFCCGVRIFENWTPHFGWEPEMRPIRRCSAGA